jgi:aspartate/methionine/tyrosine aminotransferase
MSIANRMGEMDSSGIRKVFERAQQMENPINLSIGQPDFPPPEEIKYSAIEALQKGFNRYTVTQGIKELREEVRDHLKKEKDFEPEEIMITSGVAGGIMLAFLALLNPGDKLLIPDPYFVIYKHLCKLIGAVPVFLDTYPDFEVTPKRLDGVLGRNIKLAIINNPCNPTGALIGSESLKAIARLAESRGTLILADEIYDFFTYDERPHSIGGYSRSAIILGGYSKTFGVPGWRVGYAAGPKHIIREMIKLQQYSFVCAPSVLQYALLHAFKINMTEKLNEYRRKRDMVCEGLKAYYEFTRPGGAFYLFPKAPGGSGQVFAEKAIEKNLLIVPGSVFSERDTHFRLSFSVSDDTLRKGVDALRELSEEWNGV